MRAQDVPRLLRRLRATWRSDRACGRGVERGRGAVAAPVIAIDGPAASGKGTIAAAASRAALGFHYLDSGSLYRLVALEALRSGHRLSTTSRARRARRGPRRRASPAARIAARRRRRDRRPSAARRSAPPPPGRRSCPAVRDGAARAPAGLPPAPGAGGRRARHGHCRFPDATLEGFLTASAEERARRRYKQLIEKGISITIEGLLRDIRERDARDSSRAAAPLRPADDACSWIRPT